MRVANAVRLEGWMKVTTIQKDPRYAVANDLNAFVPADHAIRPLRDQIVVEPLPWKPSAILEVIIYAKPLRGVVRAVGPGLYPKRYNGPKGRRTKSWDAKIVPAVRCEGGRHRGARRFGDRGVFAQYLPVGQ